MFHQRQERNRDSQSCIYVKNGLTNCLFGRDFSLIAIDVPPVSVSSIRKVVVFPNVTPC
jgi:hypothetical protein